MFGGIARYFREARAELGRVTWPNRSQVLEGTQTVVVFVIVFTLFLFALDYIFSLGIRTVLQ
ncbi:preprotein translocase subunit SecE [Deinobacterium chartae]|uniref:Protein translocase subunit SecE n=1 Tax=Deinobacterium chartae TaxID=521158 RepID=A0A841I6P9_9DEIO|nr:preprotein translocase subunit SecE [Deinobacterium chartae]MBB6099572.1 preprotein translocase subunit SecE [Deinobacterium chartae]